MEMAWFVPAFCLSGDTAGFSNQFGERIDTDHLVGALLEQSRQPPKAAACFGTHNLYALGMARRHLSSDLDPQVLRSLERAWTEYTNAYVSLIDDAGDFPVDAFFPIQDLPDDAARRVSLLVRGHVLEALALCPASELLYDIRFHRFVSRVMQEAGHTDIWSNVDSLFDTGPGRVPYYVSIAHLIHGLRLYREAVEGLND
jgi:hypothetical protein